MFHFNSHVTQEIRDYHLVMFIAGLVVIDVVILTTYTLAEGLRDNLNPTRTENTENPSDVQGVSAGFFEESLCTSIACIHYYVVYCVGY